jgi:Raf kinase inhibitor-like YbhB/YbcL family protein
MKPQRPRPTVFFAAIALLLTTVIVMAMRSPAAARFRRESPARAAHREMQAGSGNFTLTSSAFSKGQPIPQRYSCSGENLSPPLQWTPVAHAAAYALGVEDPDAAHGPFIHWVYFDIPGSRDSLPVGVPRQAHPPQGGTQGRNSAGDIGYHGPCPPPGKPHHYYFRFFALNAPLNLHPGATHAELADAMQGHIIAHTSLMGTFER